jgi:transcriptional regulator GlxA family with amidase domain
MSLAPEDLAAYGRALVGRELNAPPATRVVRPSPAAMARLVKLHTAAAGLATDAPDILAHPEVARATEQELVRALVTCLTEGEPVAAVRAGQRPVMQLFQQALEAHAGETLYLSELCAEIGVSDRNLRLLCRDHLGMSPHRYLWLRRMNMARRALARADAAQSTVTAIAMDHGFDEMGRFSVQYRRLFGESPSATLRRTPDEPRPARIDD